MWNFTFTVWKSASRGRVDEYPSHAQAGVFGLSKHGACPYHTCYLGEILGNIARRLGAFAALTEDGVRHIEQMSALDLHVYAIGLVASHGTFRSVDVNVPVCIDGVDIVPSDWTQSIKPYFIERR